MKRLIILLFFVLIRLSAQEQIISYSFSGGRLGDNLVSYCHAKWFAYKNNYPFLYKPFPYSDRLKMHNLEMHATQSNICKLQKQFNYADDFLLNIIPYFPESHIERSDYRFKFPFVVDWDDLDFKSQLKTMIAPINEIVFPALPTNMITLAVHVRVGTGFDVGHINDMEKLTRVFPLKAPPLSFYIDAIKYVSEYFNDQPIYLYLFTDHNEPFDIIKMYQRALNKPNITWAYRMDNSKDYVLEDFFFMTKFDCIIRNESNFSSLASKISDFKLMVYPWHLISNNSKYTVDQFIVETPEEKFIYSIKSTK